MSDSSSPRIAPLAPPYEPDVRQWLEKWMPPDSGLEPLRLFRTLALHESLASRMRPLGAGILGHGTVDPVLREVMILRTCALCGAEYEWGVHAASFGRSLGLEDAHLQATVDGAWTDPCWSPEQSHVFRLADELHEASAISDELWSALDAAFETEQILELLITAGWYHLISYLCNGVRIEREEWAERFPNGER